MYGNNVTELKHKINVAAADEGITDIEKEQEIIQLMDGFGTDVLRTAFFFVKDKTLADDIFQEVFIKVYKHLDTYRGQASIRTWILKITINQCKDHLKSAWFKRFLSTIGINELLEKQTIANYTPEDIYIDKEKNQELILEVLKLSLPLREALILHYYHNYSENEIASVLNIPQGTVRSRLHRAKLALRNRLGEREELE